MKNGCNFEVPEPGFQYTLKMFEPLVVPFACNFSKCVILFVRSSDDSKESTDYEKTYSRRGLVASKMEAALFVLQTCSERIPWGGLSCVNLFHNDRNAAEPKP